MELIIIIFGALVLDWILGDPQVSFHPVALIGKLAMMLENPIRKIVKIDFAAGMICSVIVIAIPATLAYLFVTMTLELNYWTGIFVSVFCVYISVALKSLISHSKAIESPLRQDNLEKARQMVGRIISRDTCVLDETGVTRSCLESVGENIIDGITAAIFYATVGWLICGPAGAAAAALLYRSSNTLDATFGYKNERYKHFGTFPARLDDILNFIPARLTLLAIYLAAFLLGMRANNALRCAWNDKYKHPSPNSTWGMASFAGALGVELGGPTRYKGRWKEYPNWGLKFEELSIKHIKQANQLAVMTTIIFAILMLGVIFI